MLMFNIVTYAKHDVHFNFTPSSVIKFPNFNCIDGGQTSLLHTLLT